MVKPIKHVMLDCETLAIAPDAAVIQVGLAFNNAGQNEVREMSVSPELYRDRTASFRVDQNTIAWHHKTNPNNFQKCLNSPNTLRELATFVRDAVNDAKEGGKYAIWLWTCGTDFDIPIVTNLLGMEGLLPNWGYTYVRDYRTLRELYKDAVPCLTKNEHSAGKDAWYQYEHLMEILEYMNNTSPGIRW